MVLKLLTTLECCKANVEYIVGSLPDVSLDSLPSRPFGELNNPVQGPAVGPRCPTFRIPGEQTLYETLGGVRCPGPLAPTGYVEAYV